jgi:hypothetical protein
MQMECDLTVLDDIINVHPSDSKFESKVTLSSWTRIPSHKWQNLFGSIACSKSPCEDSELKHHHEVTFDLTDLGLHHPLSQCALWLTRHAPDASPPHVCEQPSAVPSPSFGVFKFSSCDCSVVQTTLRCILESDMARRTMVVKSHRKRHLGSLRNPFFFHVCLIGPPYALLCPLLTVLQLRHRCSRYCG